MIRIEDLSLQVGSFALERLSLHVRHGEYFVLLGPNGSGKTVLLRCLAGLIRRIGGRIHIDGRDVTALAPRLRYVGYVPQDFGLFPHLTVEANVIFGLRARGASRTGARRQVADLVEMLGLRPLLQRRTGALSGGERQKVALARALAPRPHVLLLDEPVSAVDAAHRERLCADLRRVQQELRIATVHVTHSLKEVLAVSDRAGILLDGELVQVGGARELVRRPRNEPVARFLRIENILKADATPLPDGGAILSLAGHRVRCQTPCRGPVTFVVRPDLLRVVPRDAPADNTIPATLTGVIDRGPYRRLEFDAGVAVVTYVTGDVGEAAFVVGHAYRVCFPPESVHVLE